jgi:hypothetical protein
VPHNGGVAVAGKRNGLALLGLSDRAGADQLVALLGPGAVASDEDPHRSDTIVVGHPAYDGGVAVAGKRNGLALLGLSDRAGAEQLGALLGPDAIAAGEDPRCSKTTAERLADDGGVAVGRHRDRLTKAWCEAGDVAGQLLPLLGELRQAQLRRQQQHANASSDFGYDR